MRMATNIVAAQPVLASNSSHCHPVDSVCDTNVLLSHAICPNLSLVTKKIASEINCVYRLHHHSCSAMPLDLLLSRNLIPQKLILRAFSDFPRKLAPTKITCHTVLSWIDSTNTRWTLEHVAINVGEVTLSYSQDGGGGGRGSIPPSPNYSE